MLCAISGEAPQHPVASSKSGNVFEKSLIEAYIAEHGSDPVTGEELTTEDLIPLKTARAVKPRPPTLTSIPALLSTFQNEWDALALESYTLKQQLAQTRQELSTSLYEYEGALRVIARVTKERDDARQALSKISVSAGGAGAAARNGDAMMVDGQGELPEDAKAKVEQTQKKLMATRRKRPIPGGWADAETISSFDVLQSTSPLAPGAHSVAVDDSGDLVLFGGAGGKGGVYSLSQQQTVQTLACGPGNVTDTLWWNEHPVVANSAGAIKVFNEGKDGADLEPHAGACTAIALHPSNEILASFGVDKSYMIHDLTQSRMVARVFTDSEITCGAFHPDGHLLATGSPTGAVTLFNVTTGTVAATLAPSTPGSPLRDVSFSENGTFVATVTDNSSTVAVWDLRKPGVIKELEFGAAVKCVGWDYTGQFLAAGGKGFVAVTAYEKKAKSWTEVLRRAVEAEGVAWGTNGRSVVTVDTEGGLQVVGAA